MHAAARRSADIDFPLGLCAREPHLCSFWGFPDPHQNAQIRVCIRGHASNDRAPPLQTRRGAFMIARIGMKLERTHRLLLILSGLAVSVAALVWVSKDNTTGGFSRTRFLNPGAGDKRSSPTMTEPRELRLNPAAQRPGPPDPVAEQSAAESADSAARAAADLANK